MDEPLFDDDDRATFTEAVETWGLDDQIDMAVEECAELIVALEQYQRGRVPTTDVYEELADVRIMYEQLVEFFFRHIIESHIRRKMDRLEERLGEYDDG